MRFNTDEQTLTSATRQLKLILLDVDGVLTDGSLYFSNNGEEVKAFSSLDGHGVKMSQQAGLEVGIITGRMSRLLERRAMELGIELLLQGREDKLVALEEILDMRQLQAAQVAYIGDDFPDLPALLHAGVSFSVPNGHPDVRSRVDAVTEAHGGAGAVREVTDFILKAQDHYSRFLPR